MTKLYSDEQSRVECTQGVAETGSAYWSETMNRQTLLCLAFLFVGVSPMTTHTLQGASAPLVAQWSNGNGQRQQSGGNFTMPRAKSVFKLGALLVALMAGGISFLVKMSRGNSSRNDDSSTTTSNDGQWHPVQSAPPPPGTPHGVTQATYHATNPPPPPAKPLPQTQPSRNTSWIMALAFGAVAVMIALVCSGTLAVVGTRLMMVPASQPTSDFDVEFDRISREIEDARQQMKSDIPYFDSRPNSPPPTTPDIAAPATDFDSVVERTRNPTFDGLQTSTVKLPAANPQALIVKTGITRRQDQGNKFTCDAPAGGFLVGVRATTARGTLASVQPIFQVTDSYKLGPIYGDVSEESSVQLLAQPGDVVSALRVDASFRVVGMQLTFAPLNEGQVDTSQSYASPFVGLAVDRKAHVIEGEGDPFVGLCGTIDNSLVDLQLLRSTLLPKCQIDFPLIKPTSKSDVGAPKRHRHLFADDAPEGGVLVGMRFFVGQNWGGAICGLQPIYQVSNEYEIGSRCGPCNGIMRQVIAKPGYAIAKIDGNAGLVMNSAKLIFQRVRPNGFDADDSYESPRFGSPGGGRFYLDPEGRFIVGVKGTCEQDVLSLTAVAAD